MPALLWIACLLLILLSAPAWWIFRYSPVRFRTVSRPARSYADALEKIDQLQALDDEGVKPLCRSAAHLHGKRTSQCIVMFHGYTNCPHQFHQLASEYHARGFNVLVPRLPGHGLKQLDEGLVGFELESLLGSVDSAIDIANGLGDHITVTGLSLGGTLACWLAMNRSDVDKVVAISPALGYRST